MNFFKKTYYVFTANILFKMSLKIEGYILIFNLLGAGKLTICGLNLQYLGNK